jgi:hypothetical protein
LLVLFLIFLHFPDGERCPAEIIEYFENQYMLVSGKMAGGCIQYSTELKASPVVGDTRSTSLTYAFTLSGCIGSLFSLLIKEQATHSTEAGLKNLVASAEEMEEAWN